MTNVQESVGKLEKLLECGTGEADRNKLGEDCKEMGSRSRSRSSSTRRRSRRRSASRRRSRKRKLAQRGHLEYKKELKDLDRRLQRIDHTMKRVEKEKDIADKERNESETKLKEVNNDKKDTAEKLLQRNQLMSDIEYYTSKIDAYEKKKNALVDQKKTIQVEKDDLTSRLKHDLNYYKDNWTHENVYSGMQKAIRDHLCLGQYDWFLRKGEANGGVFGYNDTPGPGVTWKKLENYFGFRFVYPKQSLLKWWSVPVQIRTKEDKTKAVHFFIIKHDTFQDKNFIHRKVSTKKSGRYRYFLNYVVYHLKDKDDPKKVEIGYAGDMNPLTEWKGRNIIPRTLRKEGLLYGNIGNIGKKSTRSTKFLFDSLASTYETALHFCRKVVATKKGDPNHYYHSTPTQQWTRRTRPALPPSDHSGTKKRRRHSY